MDQILDKINNVSNTLSWRDIERFCKKNDFAIFRTKNGFKVKIKTSTWFVHLEHRTSDKLKFGIIRELRKILMKEKYL
jgi:hypothetical protein